MATRAAGPVGGQPGTVPIGDRPGTTSQVHLSSWAGTPAGRARGFAIGAFFIFTFVHVAAEARIR